MAYGMTNVTQEFSRCARDKSYSLPSSVWQPQAWTIIAGGIAKFEDMDIRMWEENPVYLIFNELFNPIDDESNRFIELFSPNKRNYTITTDMKVVRKSSDGSSLIETSLKNKRINERGLIVFCKDSSNSFRNGHLKGRCEYPLDNQLESIVVNI